MIELYKSLMGITVNDYDKYISSCNYCIGYYICTNN